MLKHHRIRAAGLILVPNSGGAEPMGTLPTRIMVVGLAWPGLGEDWGRIFFLGTGHRQCVVSFQWLGG